MTTQHHECKIILLLFPSFTGTTKENTKDKRVDEK